MALDLTTNQGQVNAWLKSIGRTDDGDCFWWFTGVTHGLTPDEGLTPLWRHENFSFGPYKKESATRHVASMEDITFYRDLQTGEVIRSFTVPYTNEKRPIIDVVTNAIHHFYDEEGHSGFVADGQDFAKELELEVTEVQDTVWLTRQFDWSFPNPLDPELHALAYSGPAIRLQMETTLKVKRSDLDDSSQSWAPAHSSYEAVTPWFPWMHMGNRPGHLITRAMGIKLQSYDQLPAHIIAASEERYPGCITGEASPPRGKDPWTDYKHALLAAE